MTTSVPAQPDRAARLRSAVARDGPHCVWCRRECAVTDPATTRRINLVRGTTDHLVPKVKGGPSWLENEVLACPRCNRERGHVSPVDWLAECVRRGWEPDGFAVLDALRALDRAITHRGGQRRARPYLTAQLRRLSRELAAA
jgi:5-methylcytosine-specific restriction endonuclease McrA